jgi:hypothetical protein
MPVTGAWACVATPAWRLKSDGFDLGRNGGVDLGSPHPELGTPTSGVDEVRKEDLLSPFFLVVGNAAENHGHRQRSIAGQSKEPDGRYRRGISG